MRCPQSKSERCVSLNPNSSAQSPRSFTLARWSAQYVMKATRNHYLLYTITHLLAKVMFSNYLICLSLIWNSSIKKHEIRVELSTTLSKPWKIGKRWKKYISLGRFKQSFGWTVGHEWKWGEAMAVFFYLPLSLCHVVRDSIFSGFLCLLFLPYAWVSNATFHLLCFQ